MSSTQIQTFGNKGGKIRVTSTEKNLQNSFELKKYKNRNGEE